MSKAKQKIEQKQKRSNSLPQNQQQKKQVGRKQSEENEVYNSNSLLEICYKTLRALKNNQDLKHPTLNLELKKLKPTLTVSDNENSFSNVKMKFNPVKGKQNFEQGDQLKIEKWQFKYDFKPHTHDLELIISSNQMVVVQQNSKISSQNNTCEIRISQRQYEKNEDLKKLALYFKKKKIQEQWRKKNSQEEHVDLTTCIIPLVQEPDLTKIWQDLPKLTFGSPSKYGITTTKKTQQQKSKKLAQKSKTQVKKIEGRSSPVRAKQSPFSSSKKRSLKDFIDKEFTKDDLMKHKQEPKLQKKVFQSKDRAHVRKESLQLPEFFYKQEPDRDYGYKKKMSRNIESEEDSSLDERQYQKYHRKIKKEPYYRYKQKYPQESSLESDYISEEELYPKYYHRSQQRRPYRPVYKKRSLIKYEESSSSLEEDSYEIHKRQKHYNKMHDQDVVIPKRTLEKLVYKASLTKSQEKRSFKKSQEKYSNPFNSNITFNTLEMLKAQFRK